MSAPARLFLALILGALAGTLLHGASDQAWLQTLNQYAIEPVGQVFLRLIFMIVVPMVFSGLVLGVYQLGQHHGLGKVVSRTLIFTVMSSLASVLIGVTLVNLVQPGRAVSLPPEYVQSQQTNVAKIESNADAAKPALQSLLEIIPKNPLESAARALEGEMLALMFFALLLGYALSLVAAERKDARPSTFLLMLEDVYEASLKIVGFAMKLAPAAVFCLVFSSSFKFGHQLLVSLALYAGVVLLGLAIQNFGVYSVLLKSLGRRSPREFFRDIRDVSVYAFATASSNATLPKSLQTAEEKLRLSPPVSRFVLTVGSTANQNGTALFEGVTVLFLAQVYGIDLTLSQQLQVVLMSVVAGIGTAGVPGGSLPLIMILLRQVGIPPEGIGIVLGVDRLLDMARTTVNVTGDLVIATLVDKSAGEKRA